MKSPLLLKLLRLQTKLESEPVTEVSGRLHFLDVFFSFGFAFDLCHICNIFMLHRVLDFILFCFAYLIMEFSKPAVCSLIRLMPVVLGNPEMDLCVSFLLGFSPIHTL